MGVQRFEIHRCPQCRNWSVEVLFDSVDTDGELLAVSAWQLTKTTCRQGCDLTMWDTGALQPRPNGAGRAEWRQTVNRIDLARTLNIRRDSRGLGVVGFDGPDPDES